MLSAVVVFGKEKEEPAGAAETPTTATTTASTPSATTTTTGTATVQGDATAGKAVFTSAGCSGCHTLKAANATGTVGPNLDTLKPAYERIVTQVENGGGAMPPFKGQLSDAQIHNVAAFVFTSTHA
jgi:mono/diheme cytochrome c family protein